MAHLVESQTISPDTWKEIECLAGEFEKTFVSLYGVSASSPGNHNLSLALSVRRGMSYPLCIH